MTNSTTATLKNLLAASLLFILFFSCNEQNSAKDKQKNTSIIGYEQTTASKTATYNDEFKANITTEIDSRVLSIFQDCNENYWFGTNAWVHRYDSKTFSWLKDQGLGTRRISSACTV